MTARGKKAALLLFFGDLLIFTVALWLALWLRYRQLPTLNFFLLQLQAFSLVFLVWTLLFFIFDLYRQRTVVFERNLPLLILKLQLANSLIAVLIFYFSPYFSRAGFAPKANLFLVLVFSALLIWLWRQYFSPWFLRRPPTRVWFAAAAEAVADLRQEINANSQLNFQLTATKPSLIVFDKYDAALPQFSGRFYPLLFQGVQFVSIQDFYEDIFERVPLEFVSEQWFLEHIATYPQPVYAFAKRVMDILIALPLALLSLIVYPLVWLLIKLEDGGPLFFAETRIGRGNRAIKLVKFRSMSTEPDLDSRQVTKAGEWLRRTRLDELPQLWSVVRGDQSLIGPRPERPDYVELYRQQIPYYDIRHLIPPGLSGWAQLYQANHPHFRPSADATREKLAYDLYYLKHRSFWLDLKIVLKTIKALLRRQGI